MEKVHFQQEQMLPDLKTLHELGVFTKAETSLIYKTRSEYERKLIRRVAHKADYLKYIQYEARLEKLRSIRWDRLGPEAVNHKTAHYSIIKRLLHVYERAVRKFKGDVALWVEYVNCAKDNGSNVIAGRVCARAIQLHPTTPYFYILAASLPQGSSTAKANMYATPSHSRALLQLGLRHNPTSSDLWREYIRFEMGFITWLQGRWSVLGIRGTERESNPETVDETEDGESIQQIMSGAIVRAVIEEAVKAMPTLELFSSILSLLSPPAPLKDKQAREASLQSELRAYVYTLLRHALPTNAQARGIYAQRYLTSFSSNLEELTLDADLLLGFNGDMQEALLEAVEGHEWATGDRRAIQRNYAKALEHIIQHSDTDELKHYLILQLSSFISNHAKLRFDASLRATHLRLLNSLPDSLMSVEQKAKWGRIHTISRYSSAGDEEIWVARLDLERSIDGQAMSIWEEARQKVTLTSSVDELWMWGLQTVAGDEKEQIWKMLLRESMCLPTLHHQLLVNYFNFTRQGPFSQTSESLRTIARDYMPSAQFWYYVVEALKQDPNWEDVRKLTNDLAFSTSQLSLP